MKSHSLFFTSLVLLLLIITNSCTNNSNTQAEPVSVQPSQSALTILNLRPQVTSTLEEITSTPLPTETSVIASQSSPSEKPVILETPTFNASNNLSTCTNQAEFIKNLSIGNNTALNPGQYFVKIWQIKNAGSCTWTKEYSLIFSSGNEMNSPVTVSFPLSVPPGGTIDLRLDLTAPEEEGSHSGSWMLQDNLGNLFGIGQSGDQPLEVIIVVRPTPAPTSGCVHCQVGDDDTP
jgi:hypothetical protein